MTNDLATRYAAASTTTSMKTPTQAFGAVALIAALVVGCNTADSSPAKSGDSSAAPATASATASPTRSGAPPTDSISAAADRGRIQGNPQAALWFVEASDFQCPFCKTWHDSAYKPLVNEYVRTGKVRMAYLNFPLSQHKNALPAAEAAMCASVQDKFWPMHDVLFETQEKWQALPNAMPTFDSLAAKLGVSMPAWRTCMEKHLTQPIISADMARSQTAGVRSTPTFFVGDQLLGGVQPYPYLRQMIEAQLAKRAAPR